MSVSKVKTKEKQTINTTKVQSNTEQTQNQNALKVGSVENVQTTQSAASGRKNITEKKDTKKTMTSLLNRADKSVREVKNVKKPQTNVAQQTAEAQAQTQTKAPQQAADAQTKAPQQAAQVQEMTETEKMVQAAKIQAEAKQMNPLDQRTIMRTYMEAYHTDIESYNAQFFANYTVKKTNFEDLSDYKVNQRIDLAIQKNANRDKLVAFATEHDDDAVPEEVSVAGADEMKTMIKNFMKLSGDAKSMDTDENFIKHLKDNYELASLGEKMSKAIVDATDGGYLPDDMDMEAVQTKIARYKELKKYLDLRREVMNSPYYVYFNIDEDFLHTETQLAAFSSEALKKNDVNLSMFLNNLNALRKTKIVAKKGLDSISEITKLAGKHEKTMMSERAEKREISAKLSESVMKFHGDQKYQDKHYDDIYSRELFEQKLQEFERLDLHALHFANAMDLADHVEQNTQIFEQAREFEHLLVLAVRRTDYHFNDSQMISLRAKIRTINKMEHIHAKFVSYMTVHEEEALHNLTFDEIFQESGSQSDNQFDGVETPTFGMDMAKYCEKIKKSYKKEHKEREKRIKLMYAMMHPEEGEDGESKPGVIPRHTLRKRVEEYQTNCLLNDYVINTEQYHSRVWNTNLSSLFAQYEKKHHVNAHSVFGDLRPMTKYMVGKSGKEIVRYLDKMREAKPEEREAFFKSVVDEVRMVNYNDMDEIQVDHLLDNIGYKYAMQGALSNLRYLCSSEDTVAKYPMIKDPKYQKLTCAYEDLGCGHGMQISLLAGRMGDQTEGKWGHAAWFYDIFNNLTEVDKFYLQLSEVLEEDNQVYEVDGHKFLDSKTFDTIPSGLVTGSSFYRGASNSRKNYGKNYHSNAAVTAYQCLKQQGLWKDTTKNELKELKTFYKNFFKEDDKTRDAVKRKVSDVLYPADEELSEEQKNENFRKALYDHVMGVDLSKFTFESYMDIIRDPKAKNGKESAEERFAKLFETVEFAEKFLEMEQSEIVDAIYGDDMQFYLSSNFTEGEISEITARCKLICKAKKFISSDFIEILDSPLLSKFSLDEMLHLPPEYYRDLAPEKGKFTAKDIKKVEQFVRKNAGYDLFTPLAIFEEENRRDSHLYKNHDRVQVVKNMLSGRPLVYEEAKLGAYGKINCTVPGMADLTASFGEKFKESKLTEEQRNQAIADGRTAIGKKNLVANTLIKRRHMYFNDLLKRKNEISTATKVKIGEERLEDLVALSIGKRDKELDDFIAKYQGTDDEKFKFFQAVTENLLKLSAELNLTDNGGKDALENGNFADKAAKMEQLGRMAKAYRNILNDNPDFVDALKNRDFLQKDSQYVIVTERLDKMTAISDYYRARKLLLTNHYYLRHENNELGSEYAKDMTAEQREMVDLIKLTDRLGAKIEKGDYKRRANDDIEDILNELEHKANHQSALTGRPDMKEITKDGYIAKVQNIQSEIYEFFNTGAFGVMHFKDAVMNYNPAEALGKINTKRAAKGLDPMTAEELERLRTKGVNDYLDAYMNSINLYNTKDRTKRERDLKDRLYKMVTYEATVTDKDGKTSTSRKEYNSCSLKDPKTGEEWTFETKPERLTRLLPTTFAGLASDEEIVDIMDGLLVGQRGDLDLNDAKQLAYAKERWLSSAKKLFELEYAATKVFEQTYGTLLEDLPPAVFMHSLGSGQKDYVKRSYIAQDMTELCGENSCLVNGKKISMGQLLVDKGMIGANELADAYKLNADYYQTLIFNMHTAYSNPEVNFGVGGQDLDGVSYPMMDKNIAKLRYDHSRVKFGGPKLQRGERRKIWKDAIKVGDVDLLGSEASLNYQKEDLNLYSKREIRAIRNQRAQDKASMEKAERDYVDNTETLFGWALQYIQKQVKGQLPLELQAEVKQLMAFHPLHYLKVDVNDIEDDVNLRNQNHQRNIDFYQKVMDFIGIGVSEEEKIGKKAQTFAYFLSIAHNCKADADIDKAGDVGKVNDGITDQKLSTGSSFMIIEARHHMFEALQKMVNVPDAEDWLTEEQENDFRDKLKYNLKYEVIRKTLHANYYTNLRDLGGRHDTKVGKDYLTLQYVGLFVSERNEKGDNLDDSILKNPEYMRVLNEYGIRFLSNEPISRPKAEAERRRREEERLGLLAMPMNVNSHLTMTNMNQVYEKQTNNNCFAVAGATLFNHYICKKEGRNSVERVFDQKDFRNYQPEILKYNQPKISGVPGASEELYHGAAAEVTRFAGEGKQTAGNIYDLADFFVQKAGAVGYSPAVHRMMFHMPKRNDFSEDAEKKSYNRKAAFISTIKEVIDGGGIVAMDTAHDGTSHYVTITDIETVNGEAMLTVYESQGYNAQKGALKINVDTYLERGTTVELNWLTDAPSPEELCREYKNLAYDEETGYSLKEPGLNALMHPTQTMGIHVSKLVDELPEHYDDDFEISVYVPNPKAELETMPLADYIAIIEEQKKKAKKKTAKEAPKEEVKETVTEEVKEGSSVIWEDRPLDVYKVPTGTVLEMTRMNNATFFSKTTRARKIKNVTFFSKTTRQKKIKNVTFFSKTTRQKKIKNETVFSKPKMVKVTDETVANYDQRYEGVKAIQDGIMQDFDKRLKKSKNRNRFDIGSKKKYAAIASAMSYFRGQTKEGALSMYMTLMLKNEECTGYEKSIRCRAFEDVFEKVLAFEPEKMSFKSLADFAKPDKFFQARVLSHAMFEFNPAWFADYERMIGDPNVKTALNVDQLKEVRARWNLFLNTYNVYKDMPRLLAQGQKMGVIVEELLLMPEAELAKRMMDKGNDQNTRDFYGNIVATKNSLKEVGVIKEDGQNALLNGNMKTALETSRKKYGLEEDLSEAAYRRIDNRRKKTNDDDYTPPENYAPKIADDPIEAAVARKMEKIDFKYEYSGIPQKKLDGIKKSVREMTRYNLSHSNALSKEDLDAIRQSNAMDERGIFAFLRPVFVDANGKPKTPKDAENFRLNHKDVEALLKPESKEWKAVFDRIITEAKGVMIPPKKLTDYDYLREHRDKAVQCANFMFHLLNVYDLHEEYLRTQIDDDSKVFLYMLTKGTDYVNYMLFHVSQALSEGGEPFEFVGSSTPMPYVIPYVKGYEYKAISKLNDNYRKEGSYAMAIDGSQYANIFARYDDPKTSPLAEEIENADHTIEFAQIKGDEKIYISQMYPKTQEYTPKMRDDCSAKLMDEYLSKHTKASYIQKKIKEMQIGWQGTPVKVNQNDVTLYDQTFDQKIEIRSVINDEVEKRVADPKVKHRYEGTTRHHAQMAGLVTLFQDKTKECGYGLCQTLLMKPEAMKNDYERSMHARAYEQVFENVLNFDLGELNFENLWDFAKPAKYDNARLHLFTMYDFKRDYFDYYETLINNPNVKTALTVDQLREVKARWELFQDLITVYEQMPKLLYQAQQFGYNIYEELLRSEDELYDKQTELNKAKTRDKANFFVWLAATKTKMVESGIYKIKNGHIEINGNIKQLFGKYRTKHGLESRTDHTKAALKEIEARQKKDDDLYEPKANYNPEKPQDPVEAAIQHEMDKIDFEYEASGIPEDRLLDIKETAKASIKFDIPHMNALSKEDELAITKNGYKISHRGFAVFLRPVNLTADGKPATKEDEEKQRLNQIDIKAVQTKDSPERKAFLTRVAKELGQMAFTIEQLKDANYIRQNRDRAIAFINRMHYILDVFKDNRAFYQKEADDETRLAMHILVESTDYVNFATFQIANILGQDGNKVRNYNNPSGLTHVAKFQRGYSYETIRALNEKYFKLGNGDGDKKMLNLTGSVNDFSDLEDAQDSVDRLIVTIDRYYPPQEELYYLDKKYGWQEKFTPQQRNASTEDQVNEFFAHRNDPAYVTKKLEDIELAEQYKAVDQQKRKEAEEAKKKAKAAANAKKK